MQHSLAFCFFLYAPITPPHPIVRQHRVAALINQKPGGLNQQTNKISIIKKKNTTRQHKKKIIKSSGLK
ncbi:hypothetical protein, partial [Enterobacter asburiae]